MKLTKIEYINDRLYSGCGVVKISTYFEKEIPIVMGSEQQRWGKLFYDLLRNAGIWCPDLAYSAGIRISTTKAADAEHKYKLRFSFISGKGEPRDSVEIEVYRFSDGSSQVKIDGVVKHEKVRFI